MTLPSSGAISVNAINTELTYSATRNSNLNESTFRQLADVPSGTISLSNFYGKSNLAFRPAGPYNCIGETYGTQPSYIYFPAGSGTMILYPTDSASETKTYWINPVGSNNGVRMYVNSAWIYDPNGNYIPAGSWTDYYSLDSNLAFHGPYAYSNDVANVTIEILIQGAPGSPYTTSVNCNLGTYYN